MKEKYFNLLSEIKSLSPGATLLAVSKAQAFSKIAELYQLGHRDFGENYVQELIEKSQLASEARLSEIRWHFIGHLQSNKIKLILPLVVSIQSVDSLALAEKLNEAMLRSESGKKLSVYFQVNIDKEESKQGFSIPDLMSALSILKKLPGLQPDGLMCIPDPLRNDISRPFQRLKELSGKIQNDLGSGLSMGMSDDYEEALKWGATIVRLGSALFGERA